MKDDRLIGLDMLRFFSMCGIIGLHVINQGGIINNCNIYSLKNYIILLMLIFFYTSVNVFGILSGYLNIDKDYNKHYRIIELISIMLFYSIIIWIIFYGFNINNIRANGIKEMILNLFPVLINRYWYITSYIFVYFMIPYLNFFCKCINKKIFEKILITIFILLSIIPNILGMIDIFRIEQGYSPFWLMYLYLLGAYVKKYNIDLERKKIIKYIILLFTVEFILNVFVRNTSYLFFEKIIRGEWFINYISPFNLIISILLLYIFKTIKLKNKKISSIFVYFSLSSFSVYIIHCNKLIFDYVLKDIFSFLLKYNSILIIVGIIMFILLIYLICLIIDFLREKIYKLFKLNDLNKYFGNKLDQIIN